MFISFLPRLPPQIPNQINKSIKTTLQFVSALGFPIPFLPRASDSHLPNTKIFGSFVNQDLVFILAFKIQSFVSQKASLYAMETKED